MTKCDINAAKDLALETFLKESKDISNWTNSYSIDIDENPAYNRIMHRYYDFKAESYPRNQDGPSILGSDRIFIIDIDGINISDYSLNYKSNEFNLQLLSIIERMSTMITLSEIEKRKDQKCKRILKALHAKKPSLFARIVERFL